MGCRKNSLHYRSPLSNTRVVRPQDHPQMMTGSHSGGDGSIWFPRDPGFAGPSHLPSSSVNIEGIQLESHPFQLLHEDSAQEQNDAKIVLTPTARMVLKRLAGYWKTGNPTLLEGPTSAGKTSYVKYLAMMTGSPYRRINLSHDTEVRDLLGRWVAGEQRFRKSQLDEMDMIKLWHIAQSFGIAFDSKLAHHDLTQSILSTQIKPHWEDGPVVQAMRRGEVLLLDEINLAKPQVIESLNSLFDKGFLTLDDHQGEVVSLDPYARVFAAINPSSYIGRKPLSDAFKSRCAKIWVPSPTVTDMAQIVSQRYPDLFDDHEISQLVASHVLVTESAEHGKIGSDLGGVVYSLRHLFRVIERFVKLQPLSSLSRIELLRREFDEVYMGLLAEDDDKQTVADLMLLSMPVSTPLDQENLLFLVTESSFIIGDLTVEREVKTDHPFIPDLNSLDLVPTPRTKKMLYKLVKALEFGEGEHVALIGERASGKTALVEYYAALKRQPFYRQVFSDKTDNMELIGAYTPAGWQDGQLLRSGRIGNTPGIFLADEFNQSRDSVQERLNSLLDQDRCLNLAERGGEQVKFDPKFKFVAAFNPPKRHYVGRKPLSLAMQGRLSIQHVPDLEGYGEHLEIFRALGHKNGLSRKISETLVKLHFWVKQNQAKDDLDCSEKVFSIRQLVYAMKAVAVLKDDDLSESDAFLYASDTYYVSPFEDLETREKIQQKTKELIE